MLKRLIRHALMMADAPSSALSLIAFYFFLLFAKLNLATTNTPLLLRFLPGESFSSLGVYFTDLKLSWLRVTV